MSTTPKSSPRWARWTERAAIAGVTLALIGVALGTVDRRRAQPVMIQSDFGAPSLMVRDCLEQDRCYYQINPFGDATALGVQHGVVFDDALLLSSFLGEPLSTYRAATELLGYGALLLFFLWARRRLGLDHALLLLGASLFTWWVLCPNEPSSIWNPALLPLPAFAFAAGSASYLLRRRLPDLLVAALSASVAAQIHAAAFVTGVALVYLVAGAPRGKRGYHALVAILAFWGALQVGSPAMFTDVFLPLDPERLGPGLLGAGAAIGILGCAGMIALARRFREGEVGLGVFLATTHLPFFIVARTLAPAEARYAFTLVPGVALFLSVATVAILRRLLGRRAAALAFLRPPLRLAGAVTLVLLLFSALPEGHDPREQASRTAPERVDFELESARQLGQHLQARFGLGFPAAFRHLRGGIRLKQLVNGLALTLPPTHGASQRGAALPDLLVLPLSGQALPERLPPDWELVGEAGKGGLLLQTHTPFLQWDQFGLLHPDPGGGLPPRWERIAYAFQPSNHPQDRELLASRSDAGLSALLYGHAGRELLLLRVPLRLPAGSPPRLLALPPSPREDGAPAGCQGVLLAIEGVDEVRASEALPARQLRLEGSETLQEGVLTLAWDLTVDPCTWASSGLPPPVLELEADDLALLAGLYPDTRLGSLAPFLEAEGSTAPDEQAHTLATRARVLLDAAEGGDRHPTRLEPRPADPSRSKEPLTGLGVKLASILALWLCFAAGVLRLLWPSP